MCIVERAFLHRSLLPIHSQENGIELSSSAEIERGWIGAPELRGETTA